MNGTKRVILNKGTIRERHATEPIVEFDVTIFTNLPDRCIYCNLCVKKSLSRKIYHRSSRLCCCRCHCFLVSIPFYDVLCTEVEVFYYRVIVNTQQHTKRCQHNAIKTNTAHDVQHSPNAKIREFTRAFEAPLSNFVNRYAYFEWYVSNAYVCTLLADLAHVACLFITF
jgi:hypothetical protein